MLRYSLYQTASQFVFVIVHKDGWALEFSSGDIRNDRQIVLAAVTQTGW
jgi:hypothetical protein